MPELELPQETDYLIVETDGCNAGWGAVLYKKEHKYKDKKNEQVCRYASGKYKEKGNISSIDAELLAVGYALDAFNLFLISKKEFTVRADCEAILKFFGKIHEKRSSKRRWLNFIDRITGRGFKVVFEHIRGKENTLADTLSRLATSKEVYSTDV